MHLICLALVLVIASADAAHAGPVFAAIGGLVSAIKGSVILSALVRIGASMLLSKLVAALRPKPKQPGIKTESTGAGSQNPCSYVLGRYATDGVHVCPPMSHGAENVNLTYVVELSDVAGVSLNEWIINGEVVTLGGTADPVYGFPVASGKFAGFAFIRFYDGSQTVADPDLITIYGSYPERPWSSAMVGRGIAYAICTFVYDRTVFSSFPTVRFVLNGIPLYDPRKDSTVGGSGAHRWANRATWEFSQNPIVMAYNLHRGIAVAGLVHGGGAEAQDLPLASWFAAMNTCDALVDNGAGGTEARFRAGYEVFVSEEPAGVLEELMKSCMGQVADVGGSFSVVAGDTPLPVFVLSDDDLLASQGGERSLFPPPQETFNAITGNYPDPAAQWEAQAAPAVTNATWEAEDGGRRLPVSVDFPAVPFAAQVQRLMRAMIAEERRFISHTEPLPPEAMVLDPLDVVAWTSERNGYSAKAFQIGRAVESLSTGQVTLAMRERDPADTAIPPGYFTPPVALSKAPASVPGHVPRQYSVGDPNLVARSPTLVISSATTGWEPVASLVITGSTKWGAVVQYPPFILANHKARGSLTAGTTGTILWRLVIVGPVGSTVLQELASGVATFPTGEVVTIGASGAAYMADPAYRVRLEVTGRLMGASDQVTFTDIATNLIFNDR